MDTQMPVFIALLQLVGGLVYLLMGGDLLVRGALALARKARISAMVVGLTVVAFGTSAPELVVTLRAALTGFPDIAIGNVVGSNIANVLLVVSLPALIYPLACNQPTIRVDATFMVLVSAALWVLAADGAIDRSDGAVLFAGVLVFLALQARAEYSRPRPPQIEGALPFVLGQPSRLGTIAFLIVAGIVMLPLGADLLVDGAVGLAARLRIPNEVIGLTVVAVGTSVPELATTLVAALKREAEVAIGNVIGSNVLNIVAILGAAALVTPDAMEMPGRFLELDLPVMLAAAVLLWLVALRRAAVGRWLGVAMLVAYAAYTVVLYATAR